MTEKNHHLSWKYPRGTFVAKELIHSDALRSLTKTETDIWIYILTLRQFPKDRRQRDYWEPINGNEIKIPTVKIRDFFDGEVRGMNGRPPNPDTISKAFRKFMRVGLLSLVYQGGKGKGDQNLYRLENKWRTWKIGDPPCFTKAGMERGKGCCIPGSGEFFVAKKN